MVGVQGVEAYFPRGGQSDSTKVFKQKTFVFEKKKDVRPPKPKLGRKERLQLRLEKKDEDASLALLPKFTYVQSLAYKQLSEGMHLMCSIKDVCKKNLNVCLPGRLAARVSPYGVSKPFSDLLAKGCAPRLKSLFKVGYHYSCRVAKVEHDSGGWKVKVSLDPAVVNSGLSCGDLGAGYVLSGAIASVEDHGYTVFTGVPALIAFLPSKHAATYIEEVNHGQPLECGQVVWCKVRKCTDSGPSKTVEVTIDPDKVSKSVMSENISEDRLNPGSAVQVVITKVLADGLAVRVADTDVVGYVEETQLTSDWSKLHQFYIGLSLKATVLYRIPLSHFFYFTFKSNTGTVSVQHINTGTIFPEAEVENVVYRGLYVKLQMSFSLTFKGIISKFNMDNKDGFPEELLQPGAKVKCRVIGYDPLEQVYLCSMKKEVLEEKYMAISDISTGQSVEVVIIERGNYGCKVKLGALVALVSTQHMHDLTLVKPEAKLSIGSKHQGRVLAVKPKKNFVSVTLRPLLVSNPPLLNFDDALPGQSYYGIIIKIFKPKLVVAFYGDLKTEITKRNLLEKISNYKVGQVVNCYFKKRDKKGVSFSLVQGESSEVLQVGQQYIVEVTEVTPKGLMVTVELQQNRIDAVLPMEHLSDYMSLCKHLVRLYSPGCKVAGAVLYSLTQGSPIFSLRKSVQTFFKSSDGGKAMRGKVVSGMQVPCTVMDLTTNGIIVTTPVPKLNRTVFIKEENLSSKNFEVNQGIMARVIRMNHLTCHEYSVKTSKKWAVTNLRTYLEELSTVEELKAGEKAEAVVTDVQAKYVRVSLKTGRHGIARNTRDGGGKEVQVGKEVKVRVLFLDPVSNLVNVHLGLPFVRKNQGVWGWLERGCTPVEGSLLAVTEYFGLALITAGPAKGVLVHIPLILHPNSRDPVITRHQLAEFSSCRILPQSAEGDFVIGYLEGQKEMNELMAKKDKFLKRENNMKGGTEKKFNDDVKEESDEDTEEGSDEDIKFEFDDDVKEESEEESDDDIKAKSDDDVKEESDEDTEEGSDECIKAKFDNDEEEFDEDKEEGSDEDVKAKFDDYVKKESDEDMEEESDDDIKEEPNKKEGSKNHRVSVDIGTKAKKKRKSEAAEDKGKRKKSRREDKARREGEEEELKAQILEEAEGVRVEMMEGEAAAFAWDATPQDLAKAVAGSESLQPLQEDSEEEAPVKKKMTPAERRAAAQEMERKIREAEEEMVASEDSPKSAEQFDRLLLGAPNNSRLWVQYMAFHLQSTEIDKARAVARRALGQINTRLEQERLNVWVALLNLENLYGTSESFKDTVEEAMKFNDEYEVCCKVLDMHAASNKITEVEQLTNTMVRKFRLKEECWQYCMGALMGVGLAEKARSFLQRALSSLPAKQHVTVLSRFALLENKHGFSEQAQALLENVLTSYPARVDIWNVYVDMLVKSRLIQLARQVLERAAGQKLPARKMKSIYTKWLTFEETHGSPEDVLKVKEAALNYVENVSSTL